jgi:hypothetical protein
MSSVLRRALERKVTRVSSLWRGLLHEVTSDSIHRTASLSDIPFNLSIPCCFVLSSLYLVVLLLSPLSFPCLAVCGRTELRQSPECPTHGLRFTSAQLTITLRTTTRLHPGSKTLVLITAQQSPTKPRTFCAPRRLGNDISLSASTLRTTPKFLPC